MATDYGTKEKDKGSDQPEVGTNFGEGGDKERRMGGKMPKVSNHAEHDEHMHKLMPAGYKGDCGY